jgi:hypothetical protein
MTYRACNADFSTAVRSRWFLTTPLERVPLRFLPPGRYRATVWQDGATPREIKRSVHDRQGWAENLYDFALRLFH